MFGFNVLSPVSVLETNDLVPDLLFENNIALILDLFSLLNEHAVKGKNFRISFVINLEIDEKINKSAI